MADVGGMRRRQRRLLTRMGVLDGTGSEAQAQEQAQEQEQEQRRADCQVRLGSEGSTAARVGRDRTVPRQKRMATEQSLASPWVGFGCAGRRSQRCSLPWGRCARGQSGEAGRLVEITKGLLGSDGYYYFSVVFRTASRTDGFPGSICTEGACRY